MRAGVKKWEEVSYHSDRSRWSTDSILFAIFHLGSLEIKRLIMDIWWSILENKPENLGPSRVKRVTRITTWSEFSTYLLQIFSLEIVRINLNYFFSHKYIGGAVQHSPDPTRRQPLSLSIHYRPIAIHYPCSNKENHNARCKRRIPKTTATARGRITWQTIQLKATPTRFFHLLEQESDATI